jgi:hypothetical protein
MVQARDSHGRFKADHTARNAAIGVAAGLGAVAAGVAAAFRFGLLDSLLPAAGEHTAPDLALDAAPAGTNRAPAAFRPDPTAPVPAGEREALRPATTVSKGFSEDRTTAALLN